MANSALNTNELVEHIQCTVTGIDFYFTEVFKSIEPEFNEMLNLIYTDLDFRFAQLMMALFVQKANEATIGIQLVSQDHNFNLKGSVRINLDLDGKWQVFGKLEDNILHLMPLNKPLNAD